MDGLRILQQLDLSSNHISTLSGPPPHIFETLRFLNLSHNGLELVLNNAFEKMISLDVVSGSFSWMSLNYRYLCVNGTGLLARF